jgi:glycosyltransferase involved in cell wall biosynthesis
MLAKITIGVTCFNAVDTIVRTLESAVTQDWENKEIIVVDDASNDGSYQLLQRWVAKHPDTKLIRHSKNQGYASALNTLTCAAKGEYIVFFDDDDCSSPSRIRLQYKRIQDYQTVANANMVLCYSNRNIVKVGQDRVDHIAYACGRKTPEPHGHMMADHILLGLGPSQYSWGVLGSCTLMLRLADIKSIGGFDESFRRCAEWDFAIRAALAGGHFIAVDEPLVTMYKTASADKAGTKPLRYSLKLRDKYQHYLKDQGVYYSSVFMAYYYFYNHTNKPVLKYLYFLLYLFSAPRKVFWRKLESSGLRWADKVKRGRNRVGT